MDSRKTDGKKTFLTILANSASSIITILVSLVTTVLITRILSTADLGIATSFSSLRSILTIICLLSVYISINRILLDVDDKKFEFLSSIYIFSSLFCIIAFLIYFIFRKQFNSLFDFNTSLMFLMFSIIFLSNGATIINSYWNYEGAYKKLLVYNIVSSSVAQITSVILAFILPSHKYLGRIIGVEIFNVLIGLVYGVFIVIKGKFNFNKDYILKSLKICLPMIPHLLSQILLTSSDLLMIKSIIGNSASGLYSMAYTIANVFYLIMIQIFMPWSPWVYRRIKENDIKSITDNSKLIIMCTAYLALGLFTVAPEMINIFLPKSYFSVSLIIAPICTGIFFQIMSLLFYDVEYYYKKTKQISFISVIAAVLNLFLNLIFIRKFGYQAAAYTTLVSYFVFFVMHYIGKRCVIKVKIYDMKYLMIVSLLLLIVCFTFVFTNNNIIIRYLVLFIVTVFIIIKYKDDFFGMIKNVVGGRND